VRDDHEDGDHLLVRDAPRRASRPHSNPGIEEHALEQRVRLLPIVHDHLARGEQRQWVLGEVTEQLVDARVVLVECLAVGDVLEVRDDRHDEHDDRSDRLDLRAREADGGSYRRRVVGRLPRSTSFALG
jgi:hypothetical protein